MTTNQELREKIEKIFSHYWIEQDSFATGNYKEEIIDLIQMQQAAAVRSFCLDLMNESGKSIDRDDACSRVIDAINDKKNNHDH